MIPVPNFTGERTVNGNLRTAVPKFRSELGKRICRILKLGENIYINLDEMGSFIYEKCDGRKSVKELAEDFMGRYGDEPDKALPRLRAFLTALERNGLISYNGSLEP